MIAEESMNNNNFDDFTSADKHRRLPIRLSIVANHNNQKGFSQKNKEGIAVVSLDTKQSTEHRCTSFSDQCHDAAWQV